MSLGTRVFIIEERKYRLLSPGLLLVLDLIYKYHPHPRPAPGELESKYPTVSLSPPMSQDLALDSGFVTVHHSLRHNRKV